MKNIFLIIIFCITFNTAKAAIDSTATWKPVVPNKVQEKYIPVSHHQLNGLLNDHVMINLGKRLLKIDSAILLSGFERRPGSQTWIDKQAYSIALGTDKKQKLFILVPFADAGQQSTWQQVWIVSNEVAKP